jgi:ABC-2 type transport system permease protein
MESLVEASGLSAFHRSGIADPWNLYLEKEKSMKIFRILTMLKKDLIKGPKGFFFIQAVLTPIITSLLVLLLFGSALSGKPSAGFVFEGETELRELIQRIDFIRFSQYESQEKLKDSVLAGKLDVGIVIPAGFDEQVKEGKTAQVKNYIWGESLLKDRSVIFAGLSDIFLELAGKEVKADITVVTLGDGENTPLGKRFLPLLVLLAIVVSGLVIPAAYLVEEKQKRTLSALTVTPASFREVLAAKCLYGFILSIIMGVFILILNNSFGTNPGLLFLALAMAAAFASTLGGLAGMMMNDAASLMNFNKSLILVLYTPGILNLFPGAPDWIAKLFPTYYIFSPVLKITQNNAGLSEIGLELLALAGFILAMIAVLFSIEKKKKIQAA